MTPLAQVLAGLRQAFHVPTATDDQRRRKLLQILVDAVFAMTAASLLINLTTYDLFFWSGILRGVLQGKAVALAQLRTQPHLEDFLFIVFHFLFLGLVGGVHLLNQREKTHRLGAWLFVILITASFNLADNPVELTVGRSNFIWAIPILTASIVLPPATALILGGLVSLNLLILAVIANHPPNLPAMLGYMALGVAAWLSARSLQRAVKDARTRNEQLQTQIALTEEARKKAEAADAFKTELLNTVSHELRSPIQAISNFVWLLIHQHLPVEKVAEALITIDDSAETLKRIVNDLLDAAKLAGEKVVPHRDSFEVQELVRDVDRQGQALTSRLDTLRFSVKVDKSMPKILYEDVHILQRIIMNLVTNAVKFSVQGQIDVTLELGPSDALWTLRVRDTGIGIALSDQERIFEKFVQLNVGMDRKYPGTGLGLAIVKDMVDLLDGHIKVNSIVGEGTTFEVCLPLHASPRPKTEKSLSTKARVLI